LPFRAPSELYRLYTAPSPTGDDDKLSALELTELAAQSTSISGLTFFGNYGAGPIPTIASRIRGNRSL
jgi:hypothetical protein